MISLYQVDARALQPVDSIPTEVAPRCWINLSAPTHNELHELNERYGIPMEMLTAALDPEERARYEQWDNHLLILLRVPIDNYDEAEEENGIPYITRPLGVVIGPDVIVTVCTKENSVLNDFVERKVKQFNPEQRTKFVFQIFARTVLKYLRFLKDIELNTNDIERELRQSLKNDDLLKLMQQEKSLVFFTTSLRSNHYLFRRIRKSRLFKPLREEEKDLLEEVLIDNAQAIETAGIYTNILNSLMDALASVINNNLNSVMKSLTKVTILLMIPTLVTSIYGMNIGLPWQSHPNAIFVVLVLCALGAGIGFLLFSVRRNLR
jgi:magnesium transporter